MAGAARPAFAGREERPDAPEAVRGDETPRDQFPQPLGDLGTQAARRRDDLVVEEGAASAQALEDVLRHARAGRRGRPLTA